MKKSNMMKGKRNVSMVIILIFIIGLICIGCDKKNTPREEDKKITSDNEVVIAGEWDGNIRGNDVTVVIAQYHGVPSPYLLGGWLINIPSANYLDTGTGAMIDGITITLYSNNLHGGIVGTAVVVNNNTLVVTMGSNSIAPGAHTFTRKSEK